MVEDDHGFSFGSNVGQSGCELSHQITMRFNGSIQTHIGILGSSGIGNVQLPKWLRRFLPVGVLRHFAHLHFLQLLMVDTSRAMRSCNLVERRLLCQMARAICPMRQG